jgi:putative membrane protein
MAIILGLVNAVIRPILKVLSCPLIILTLGLFTIIINAVSFMIASNIAVNWFNVGFYVDDFWAALLGSLVVSAVSIFVNMLIKDEKA